MTRFKENLDEKLEMGLDNQDLIVFYDILVQYSVIFNRGLRQNVYIILQYVEVFGKITLGLFGLLGRT